MGKGERGNKPLGAEVAEDKREERKTDRETEKQTHDHSERK